MFDNSYVNMVTKIPALETLQKVNRHIDHSFKPSLGCSACNLVHDPAAAFFPPLGLTALIQHTIAGQGTTHSLSPTN